MVFEDLHQYDDNHTVYAVCNESITEWRKALEGVSVESAAGICSGGEISFFAILPVVTKKLQLIDHAYNSMFYAIGKHHLVEKLSAKKAYEALSTGEIQTLLDLFVEGNQGLPTCKAYEERSKKRSYYGYPTLEKYALNSRMKELSQDDIKAFKANRDKLSFAHGDLTDLVKLGPFDLVYLSNAPDYPGRDQHKNYPILEMVKPGGLVCYVNSSHYGKPRALASCKSLYSNVYRTSMNWTYNVVKVPE